MFSLKKWRRRRIGSREFPQNWRIIVEKNVPLYHSLPLPDKQQLLRHILVFMAEKQFEGCRGLEVIEIMKLTIAAQACMLLLHRETDYYPGLSSVLIYPEAYLADHKEYLGGGFVIEGTQVRAGESWHRGSVVLSWDDIQRQAFNRDEGRNVILHEFSHQLYNMAGRGEGSEIFSDRSRYINWISGFEDEYNNFCEMLEEGRETFLDEYAATNEAEFFAVATEYFFEKPVEFRECCPELYDIMSAFYNQNPAAFFK